MLNMSDQVPCNDSGGSGGGAGGSGGAGGGNGIRWPGLPAFLTKIFNIVSDPNTNSLISWSVNGNSFIIWDYIKFSVEILPKHFKHDHFSSFVYQLNNYGFRKIGVEHKWEYANPYFQEGKACLLTNIKRRNQNQPECVTRKRRLQTEPNNQISDELILEIQKLKSKQEEMEHRISVFESDVEKIEKNTQRLIMCWAKACDEILCQKMRCDNGKVHNIDAAADDDGKRRKSGKNVILIEDDEKIDDQDEEEDSEIQIIEDSEKDKNNPGLKDYEGEINQDYTCWKNILMEDDQIFAKEMAEVTNGSYPGLKDYEGENNQDQENCGIKMKDNEKMSEANPAVEDCDGQNNQVSETNQLVNSQSDSIKECEDYVFWSKILMEETDESCDNGSGTEIENRSAKIALDLVEAVIAKLDDHHK